MRREPGALKGLRVGEKGLLLCRDGSDQGCVHWRFQRCPTGLYIQNQFRYLDCGEGHLGDGGFLIFRGSEGWCVYKEGGRMGGGVR